MKTFIKTMMAIVIAMLAFNSFAQEIYTVDSTKKLNVRANASSTADIIYQYEPGDQVAVYAIDGEWAQVYIDGNMGWVSTSFLTPVQGTDQQQAPAKSKAQQFVKSLEKYQNKDFSMICFWAAIIAIVLSAISLIVVFQSDSINTNLLYTGVGTFIFGSLAEFVYLITSPDPLWFCFPSEVGWIMMIIDFILFGVFVAAQCFTLYVAITALEGEGGFNCLWPISYIGTPIAIIAFCLTASFWEQYVDIVLICTGAMMLIQITAIMINAGRNGRAGFGAFISLFYLLGVTSTAIAFTAFFMLLVVIVIIIVVSLFALYIFFGVLGSGSGEKTILKDQYGNRIEVDENGYGDDGHKYEHRGGDEWERRY